MNWHTSIIVRNLGLCDYPPVMEAMRIWTCRRTPSTLDEIWMLEHLPVYTRGVSCRDKPRKLRKKIELIDSDRGGQITYHGPGQLVVYLLLDLRRLGLGVRKLVALMEQTAIDFLREHKIDANVKEGAPGVYVSEAKVAAIGIRVRKGCSYHGFSLNVDMDLAPFEFINPCGYADLKVTQLKDLGISVGVGQVRQQLIECLARTFRYRDVRYTDMSNTQLEKLSVAL